MNKLMLLCIISMAVIALMIPSGWKGQAHIKTANTTANASFLGPGIDGLFSRSGSRSSYRSYRSSSSYRSYPSYRSPRTQTKRPTPASRSRGTPATQSNRQTPATSSNKQTTARSSDRGVTSTPSNRQTPATSFNKQTQVTSSLNQRTAKPNSLGEGLNNQPQQTITPGELQQKKKGYWARWGSDLKRCTIECLMLTAQIGMTVADFVKFGKENQLYNERQEAEKAEWERRRKLENEDFEKRLELERQPSPQEDFIEKHEDQQICSSNAVAPKNRGSPFFFCPELADSDDMVECCGKPGEQVCCAHSDFKSAYIVSDKPSSAVNSEATKSLMSAIGLLWIATIMK